MNPRRTTASVSCVPSLPPAACLLTWVSVFVMSRAEARFVELQADLPNITVYALTFASWMRCYWYFLFLGLALDGIAYFFLARLRPRWNWLAAIWAMTPLLMTIVALGLITTAVVLPLERVPSHQPSTAVEQPR